MNKALFSSDVEKNQHESALQLLCEEFPTQSRQVIELCENELAAIITEATIAFICRSSSAERFARSSAPRINVPTEAPARQP